LRKLPRPDYTPVLEAIENRLKANPGKITPEIAEQLEQARYNFNLVAYGVGLHNYEYSLALLKWTRETCQRIDAELK